MHRHATGRCGLVILPWDIPNVSLDTGVDSATFTQRLWTKFETPPHVVCAKTMQQSIWVGGVLMHYSNAAAAALE